MRNKPSRVLRQLHDFGASRLAGHCFRIVFSMDPASQPCIFVWSFATNPLRHPAIDRIALAPSRSGCSSGPRYRAGSGSNSFAVQMPRAWSLAMNLTNAAPASGEAALASTAPSYEV